MDDDCTIYWGGVGRVGEGEGEPEALPFQPPCCCRWSGGPAWCRGVHCRGLSSEGGVVCVFGQVRWVWGAGTMLWGGVLANTVIPIDTVL